MPADHLTLLSSELANLSDFQSRKRSVGRQNVIPNVFLIFPTIIIPPCIHITCIYLDGR